MARKVYARRYAQAIFEIALASGELEKWQADLAEIASVAGSAETAAFLGSPQYYPEAKAKLLSGKLGGVVPLALNMVLLLVKKCRLDIIGDILEEYQRLLDGYHGIEQAEVVTAVALNEADKEMVTRKLEAVTGKKLVLKTKVDTGIIGGIIARIGGKLLDGSTRNRLAVLKKELAEAEK